MAEADPRFSVALRQICWTDRHESIIVIAYGTVLGFAYPRLFWEHGEFVDRGGFLFGSIVWARNGLPSVALFVFVLFGITLVLLRFRVSQRYWHGLTGQSFAALVLGFVSSAVCLFVLTGYAGKLWFYAILWA